jgi:hypothetical protein
VPSHSFAGDPGSGGISAQIFFFQDGGFGGKYHPAYPDIQSGTKVASHGVKNKVVILCYFMLLSLMFTCELVPL